METIKIIIPGKPQGKDRPRFGKNNQVYTTRKTSDYEKYVKACALIVHPQLSALSNTVFSGEIAICIKAFYEIPKTITRRGRLEIDQGKRPTSKPDVDNVAKIICDALNGTAYMDDQQICLMTIEKQYSDTPRVEVTLIYSGE
ncbi:MAG: RusA family crossover junction endodeoxyribonuclease [Eubacteriaceae bacterium]